MSNTASTVTDVMHYFKMSASEFMKEWRELPDEYKEWYREEVGKEIGAVHM